MSIYVTILLTLFLGSSALLPDNVEIISSSSVTARVAQAKRYVENQQIAEKFENMNEIIQSAKDAAAALSSPPRIYSTSGNSTSLWPDHPGSVETTYGTRGIYRPGEDWSSGTVPMTLTTLVEAGSDPNSYEVTFQSVWTESNIVKRHAWKFNVKANHQVTFSGEGGDDLPPLPM